MIETNVSISESEIENGSEVIVFSDADLERELARLKVAIESLELPYKSDYPI